MKQRNSREDDLYSARVLKNLSERLALRLGTDPRSANQFAYRAATAIEGILTVGFPDRSPADEAAWKELRQFLPDTAVSVCIKHAAARGTSEIGVLLRSLLLFHLLESQRLEYAPLPDEDPDLPEGVEGLNAVIREYCAARHYSPATCKAACKCLGDILGERSKK